MAHEIVSRLLTEAETARYLNCSRTHLRRDRMRVNHNPDHEGLPFVQLGRGIRYDRADLDRWIDSKRVGGES